MCKIYELKNAKAIAIAPNFNLRNKIANPMVNTDHIKLNMNPIHILPLLAIAEPTTFEIAAKIADEDNTISVYISLKSSP